MNDRKTYKAVLIETQAKVLAKIKIVMGDWDTLTPTALQLVHVSLFPFP